MMKITEIKSLQDQIQYLREHGLICRSITHPKGEVYEVTLLTKGKSNTVLFYEYRLLELYHIEIKSQRPVDPEFFWDVQEILTRLKCHRGMDWHMMDDGFYSLRIIGGFGDKYFENILSTIKRMWKLYEECKQHIENVAHGIESHADIEDKLYLLDMLKW